MGYAERYLSEAVGLTMLLDPELVERIALRLALLRSRHGRLFCIGAGGGAANAEHAVSDFRKGCGIEAYAPGVAELTARTNDDGWGSAVERWLRVSRLRERDGLFVFSVSGGGEQSLAVGNAIAYAVEESADVFGVVGGGAAERLSDTVIVVPYAGERRYAHIESLQVTVLHLLANHPLLQEGA